MLDSHWAFSVTPFYLITGIAFVLFSLYQSWRMIRGPEISRRLLFIEGLRLLISVLIAITLLKPELVRISREEREPVVAVLMDRSGSTDTQDITTNATEVVTRRAWLDSLSDRAPWNVLGENGRVELSSFGAPDNELSEEERLDQGTDLNLALNTALDSHANLKAVLLLTDGDWNKGDSPVEAAARLSQRQVPVYAVAVGRDQYLPDLVLTDVSAPGYGLVEEHIAIPFSIQSHLDSDVKTTITLESQHGVETTKDITIPARGLLQDTLIWMPTEEDNHKLTLSFPKSRDEFFEDNNSQSFDIALRREVLKVLVVESLPRWEFRYLRNALMRDPGIDVDCLLLHPKLGPAAGETYLDEFPEGLDELSDYDVVFLGDVGVGGNELTRTHMTRIKGLVEHQGSGLVIMPGPRGRVGSLLDSPIAPIIPVLLDADSESGFGFDRSDTLQLTSHGRGHFLTMLGRNEADNYEIWKRLPGFYWYAPVLKNKPGSDVLAVHATRRNKWGRIPLLVTRHAGSGKVLFMGTDSAWRWRRGVEDRYHYRFWSQVIRWMAHQRHLSQDQGIRVFFTPEDPVRGETVFLNATVFNQDGFPLKEGPVRAIIKAPDGSAQRIALEAEPGGWGVFKGRFTPRVGGTYKLDIRSEKAGRELSTPVTVRAPQREKPGQPARSAVLRELAGMTGGQWGNIENVSELITGISMLPEPSPLEQRVRVWCHPWWCAGIVLLCAMYWSARKLAGVV